MDTVYIGTSIVSHAPARPSSDIQTAALGRTSNACLCSAGEQHGSGGGMLSGNGDSTPATP